MSCFTGYLNDKKHCTFVTTLYMYTHMLRDAMIQFFILILKIIKYNSTLYKIIIIPGLSNPVAKLFFYRLVYCCMACTMYIVQFAAC